MSSGMLMRLHDLLTRRRSRYKQAFGTPSGKWVLADMATRFHAMAPTYVAGDPTATAHQEGQRNVLLWILQQLSTTEDDVREIVDAHSRHGDYLA